MIRKISTMLLVSLLVVGFASAQSGHVAKKAPIKMNETGVVTNHINQHNTVAPNNPSAANWVVVDSMANIYGPAISVLNPLVYDPYSDVVAIVHRGQSSYATGSGELWYNISQDRGQTWTRVGSVNASNTQQLARYPSMAISNPDQGDISATTGLFTWPELISSFGWIGYGADQPLGTGAAYSAIIEGNSDYSSQVPCWASDNSAYVFWASDNQTDASITLFRTNDFVTVDVINPPQWSDAVFGSGGNITMGGVSYNGVQYYAVEGTFDDPNPSDPINYGWYLGYSKSTDDGATWSDWNVIDPRVVPGLEDFDELYDYIQGDAYVSFCGDINVDADGYVHIVTALTDTNTANNASVEIYETASGWQGKVIANGLVNGSYSDANGAPSLGQMGPSNYIAFDETRTVMATQWVNGNPADSLCDIYFSYRTMSGPDAEWSAPMNLTETPDMNESQSHFSPMLATDGPNSFTAFSMYGYEKDYFGPAPDPVAVSNVFVAPVPFETTPVGVSDDVQTVHSYSLDQNYPNPFNPTTSIKYSLAERSNVSIKVYDLLGNEVATLVNTTKDAGNYAVNFNASNLASGLYIYKIQAGSFVQSKKMMLLK